MGVAGGCAQGGGGDSNAVLCQGDYVHVAFNYQQSFEFAVGLQRLVKPIEFSTFLENVGFRRVEVFGFVVAQYPAAKSDDPATLVANREHHPVTKAIVNAALIIFHQHACFHQQGFLVFGFPQGCE